MLFDKGLKYKFAIENPTVGEFIAMADKMRELRLKNETKLEEKFMVGAEGVGFVFSEDIEGEDTDEESAKD
jgi:hypothetical protein